MSQRTVIASLVTLFRSAGWAPTLVFGIHVFISRGLNAYVLYPPLDIPMHFFGGVVIALFIWRCFAAISPAAIAPPLRPALMALLVFSFSATATVFWEFAEFLSDRLFSTNAQVSLEDTLLDMALGLAGCLCWLGIAARRGTLAKYAPLSEGSRAARDAADQPGAADQIASKTMPGTSGPTGREK